MCAKIGDQSSFNLEWYEGIERSKIFSVIFDSKKLFQTLSYHDNKSGHLGVFRLEAISIAAKESSRATMHSL